MSEKLKQSKGVSIKGSLLGTGIEVSGLVPNTAETMDLWFQACILQLAAKWGPWTPKDAPMIQRVASRVKTHITLTGPLIDRIPTENLRGASDKFTRELIQAIEVEDDDDLQQLWAKLVAGAMDDREQAPDTLLVSVLRQMSGEDIRQFKLLIKMCEDYFNNRIAAVSFRCEDWNSLSLSEKEIEATKYYNHNQIVKMFRGDIISSIMGKSTLERFEVLGLMIPMTKNLEALGHPAHTPHVNSLNDLIKVLNSKFQEFSIGLNTALNKSIALSDIGHELFKLEAGLDYDQFWCRLIIAEIDNRNTIKPKI